MKAKDTAKLLHFGDGRHTVYLGARGNCKSIIQGYADPDSFLKPYHWWNHPPEQLSTEWDTFIVPEAGIPVVDVREAVKTEAGFKYVFSGPMLNPDLPETGIDRMPIPSPVMAPAIAANGMGLMVLETMQARQTPKPGSLDFVGIETYITGWREHGARIGRLFVENNQGRIEWEN